MSSEAGCGVRSVDSPPPGLPEGDLRAHSWFFPRVTSAFLFPSAGWVQPFDPRASSSKDFFVAEHRAMQVPTMKQKARHLLPRPRAVVHREGPCWQCHHPLRLPRPGPPGPTGGRRAAPNTDQVGRCAQEQSPGGQFLSSGSGTLQSPSVHHSPPGHSSPTPRALAPFQGSVPGFPHSIRMGPEKEHWTRSLEASFWSSLCCRSGWHIAWPELQALTLEEAKGAQDRG